MGSFRVIRPGLLTTVQDLGRSGCSMVGVSEGGAADPLSLRIGNRLLGNPDGTPALEMTLTGAEIVLDDPAELAVTGGECQVTHSAAEHPRMVAPYAPFSVAPGDRVGVGPIVRGVRAYLCITGGVNVPHLLGSASTHLGAAFGGYAGRPIRAGDRVEFVGTQRPPAKHTPHSRLVHLCAETTTRRVIRALDGSHAAEFDARSRESFWSSAFEVSQQSDRVGVRLSGKPIAAPHGGRMPSDGTPWGAVEVTPSGEPIVLLCDHPTTGGYPVIACIATVDLPVLGQLRPGDAVRFERICQSAALDLLRQRERSLDEVLPLR